MAKEVKTQTFIQALHKRKKNSSERKSITVEMDGMEYHLKISKVPVGDNPPGYIVYKQKVSKAMQNICEYLLNHVHDPDTDELYFKTVDILHDTEYTAFHKYVMEQIPGSVLLQIMKEINDFTGVETRQEDIDAIKNL